MKFFKEMIKKIKCKHINNVTLYNLHGDQIIGDTRSIRECRDCGKVFRSKVLDYTIFHKGDVLNKYEIDNPNIPEHIRKVQKMIDTI